MPPTLPHRFSEKAFRKYEKIIALVCNRYPAVVEIRPSQLGLSSETLRGRLRDAWTSHLDHSWESQLVDREKFVAIPPQSLSIVISKTGLVLAGRKEEVKAHTAEPTIFESLDVVSDEEIIDGTSFAFNEIIVCAKLAAGGGLKKRVRIKLSPDEGVSLMGDFDIVLDPQPDNSYLLS